MPGLVLSETLMLWRGRRFECAQHAPLFFLFLCEHYKICRDQPADTEAGGLAR